MSTYLCDEFDVCYSAFDCKYLYEKGIRGGITRVIRHYAQVNNKYM